MARPRKIAEDELLNICVQYKVDTPYVLCMKYKDLVEYAKTKFGCKNITYQDFSRNKAIRQFVDLYNQQKDMTSFVKLNKDKMQKFNFNVDTLVDKYSNDPKQFKAVLKLIKDSYDKAYDALAEAMKSDSNKANDIKQQEKVIKDLKVKNKELREEISKQKKANSESYRIKKLKYMYLLLTDMLAQNKCYINTEEQVLDILKNFGYSNDDIIDIERLINEELLTETIISISTNYTNDDEADDIGDISDIEENNVVPFKEKLSELNLPDFLT